MHGDHPTEQGNIDTGCLVEQTIFLVSGAALPFVHCDPGHVEADPRSKQRYRGTFGCGYGENNQHEERHEAEKRDSMEVVEIPHGPVANAGRCRI